MEKIALFADVQNIYYTTQHAYNGYFDYQKFWNLATQDKQVIAAYAYAIERNNSKQQQFQSRLEEIGFTLRLKPFIQRQDGTAKGDWDVGITIDILETAAAADRIILLSGDGDFAYLLQHIMKKHPLKTDVYGVPTLTSGLIKQTATCYHPILKNMLMT